jgi:hypothetical protein
LCHIFGGVHQSLALAGKDEIDDHRGAARQRRARAAFEIVGGIGAHEGHLQMRVRIDPAGHDEAAGRVEFHVARRSGPISTILPSSIFTSAS